MTENTTPAMIDCKVNLTKVNEMKFFLAAVVKIIKLNYPHYSPDYYFHIYKYYPSKFCCCPGVMMAINNVIKPPMFTAEAKIVSKSQPDDDWRGSVSVSRAREHWPGRLKHLPCNEVLLGDQVC